MHGRLAFITFPKSDSGCPCNTRHEKNHLESPRREETQEKAIRSREGSPPPRSNLRHSAFRDARHPRQTQTPAKTQERLARKRNVAADFRLTHPGVSPRLKFHPTQLLYH